MDHPVGVDMVTVVYFHVLVVDHPKVEAANSDGNTVEVNSKGGIVYSDVYFYICNDFCIVSIYLEGSLQISVVPIHYHLHSYCKEVHSLIEGSILVHVKDNIKVYFHEGTVKNDSFHGTGIHYDIFVLYQNYVKEVLFNFNAVINDIEDDFIQVDPNIY